MTLSAYTLQAKGSRGNRMTKKIAKKAVSKALVVSTKKDVAPTGVVDVQSLMATAIQNKLPLAELTAAIDRLQTMRREMKMEWAREQYFAALSKFQAECPTIGKTHQVRNKDKQSGADKGLRYAYAAQEDLVEGIRPLLGKYGFSFTFKSQQDKDAVTAICHVHQQAGDHEEVCSFTAPIDHDSYMTEPQKVAAALTFACRYALKNAFGIQTRGEDMDESLPGFDQKKREPIKQSEPRNVTPPPQPLTTAEKIQKCLSATEVDPATKAVVQLFKQQEADDYMAEVFVAKDNQVELNRILADIIETGKKRRAAVKGE